MADYGIEKAYFSITFVTCTMRRESKIARVETVSVGTSFNKNSLLVINIVRAKIDNKNKNTHVERRKVSKSLLAGRDLSRVKVFLLPAKQIFVKSSGG